MSTTKTIKIQKNKILTYSINKAGFQTVNKTITVTGDTTITENMVSTTGSAINQLGDRLLGISTFFMYFTPSGTYDVDSLKFITASQTTGNGLSNIQVVKGTSNTEGETQTWLSKVEKELSIITPKGTSKTFVFTYNGTTWDITGDLTLSGQDIADYGITFTGTPANGDVITVVETQYNKFACYVLDANYRNNKKRYTTTSTWGDVPFYYYGNDMLSVVESATYFNNYYFSNYNLNSYPVLNLFKNYGNFILPNGIKINAIIPNTVEIDTIYNNRIALDSFDPIIQGGSTTNSLTNWGSFSRGGVWTCVQRKASQSSGEGTVVVRGSTEWAYPSNKDYEYGCIPVFEVPVM